SWHGRSAGRRSRRLPAAASPSSTPSRWVRRPSPRQTDAVDTRAELAGADDWLELRHPRIERTRRVVLNAAIALLAESGYAGATIEAIAARSGVAKSTIYRHWPSRLELINDAFQELKPPAPTPTEGDVRERTIAVLEEFARGMASSVW